MGSSTGPLAGIVVPADASSLAEADVRTRLGQLRDAVSVENPGCDPARITSLVFDILMDQAAIRIAGSGLTVTRERCLGLLADRGVLRELDAPWAKIR